jgi:hypothetical protein
VAYALMQLGVEKLEIVDTDPARAQALATRMQRDWGERVQAGEGAAESLGRTLSWSDGIVNTTPVGMAKYPGMPFPADLLRGHHWVAEIIYFPQETELLRAARALGRPLADGPSSVHVERAEDTEGRWLLGEHDGYLSRFGLLVSRRLFLSLDGRDLRGEDAVSCPDAAARQRYAAPARNGEIPFCVRFHLGPDVAAERSGAGVALALPDGARWRFEASGARVDLVESVILDDGPAPRPGRQIVAAGKARDYWGRIVWRFRQLEPARRGAEQPTAEAAPAARE